jgi:hypothetical protein
MSPKIEQALALLRQAGELLQAEGLAGQAAALHRQCSVIDVLGATLAPASSATTAERDAARAVRDDKLKRSGARVTRYNDKDSGEMVFVAFGGDTRQFRAW